MKNLLSEMFLYIFNPSVFLVLGIVTLILVLEQPLLLVGFAIILIPIILVGKSRILFFEFIQDNLILFSAFFERYSWCRYLCLFSLT